MKPYFTVYTPTYERGHLLPRVFESLLIQEDQDFEWVIVDDGSTDDTEDRARAWMESAPFPVRYLKQANQGKHVATNRAVELAAGGMFVVVDSDDWLATGALRAIRSGWESIPADQRERFANIAGLFLDPAGKPMTKPFPADVFDCNSVEIETRHGIHGEIAMATRVEVRRRFPFPEDVGRYCMPSLVWNRIAARFLTRYLNMPLQFKDYQNEGLTLGGVHRKVALSPQSFRLRSRELLDLPVYVPGKARTRAMRMYIRASLHAGISPATQWSDSGHPLLWLSQFLAGRREFRRDVAMLSQG